MKASLHVALVYSSRKTAQHILSARRVQDPPSANRPPPDLLVEYDSESTIAAVASALASRHRVSRIEGDAAVYERLQATQPDLVFNISEGFRGANRESHIPIVCEMLGLPYTGSDALTLGLCLDKARTKEILLHHRIPTPAFQVISSPTWRNSAPPFPLPAIIKPLREGSSQGIHNDSLITRRAQLARGVRRITRDYRQPALLEEFLPGREFTISVLGNAPRYELLPIIEIDHSALPPGSNPIYGYEAKWVWDNPRRALPILLCPAKLPRALAHNMRALVRRALTVLRVRDWCRVDLRLDAKGHPQILELNPLPGILPNPQDNSALPLAARCAGYSYENLLLRVVELAWQRNQQAL